MQLGFAEFLQHVVSLIRLLKLYLSQKSFIEFSPISVLKSPTIIKLSYRDKYKSKLYLSFVDGCLYYLYVGYRNRKLAIFFCKLISRKHFLLVKFQQIKVLRNIFPNIKQNSATINVSIYSKRITKPFYKKLTFWKLSSIFVSDNISKSTLLLISFTADSNLFLIEFILRRAKMSLFRLLLRMYFKWLVSLVSLKTLDLYSVDL